MSWNPNLATHDTDTAALSRVETVIIPRSRDIGGFEVRRALPAPPLVHSVIPLFRWEDGTEPDQPMARRRTRRSG